MRTRDPAHQGCQIQPYKVGQNGSENKTNPGHFTILEPTYSEIKSLKVADMLDLVLIWPTLGVNLTSMLLSHSPSCGLKGGGDVEVVSSHRSVHITCVSLTYSCHNTTDLSLCHNSLSQ